MNSNKRWARISLLISNTIRNCGGTPNFADVDSCAEEMLREFVLAESPPVPANGTQAMAPTIVKEGDSKSKNWEVWCEGFLATGDNYPAWLVGIVKAKSFLDAVVALRDDGAFNRPDLIGLSYYGCRLFDNELEARKFNG